MKDIYMIFLKILCLDFTFIVKGRILRTPGGSGRPISSSQNGNDHSGNFKTVVLHKSRSSK